MKTTADGLVIWENKTGEADRVITLLTKDGVISAYAKNSLRPKNKLTSSTAMLTFSNLELFSGKNMYTVDDAQTLNRFIKLSSDVEGYSLATYFCELLKLLAPIEDDAGGFLSLMMNCLYLLNEQKKAPALIKAVFELRIMSYAGYMPDIVECSECGAFESDRLSFDFQNGTLMCEACANLLAKQVNCSRSVLFAMRHIIYSDLKKAFSFELNKESQRLLNAISEQYVITHIERIPATLEFYKSIS
ncbi:MAG: DNA repair protein RecO [Oscillospiraceae bacterium]